MPAFSLPLVKSAPFTRSLAIAALLGATFLVTPFAPARAADASTSPTQLSDAPSPAVHSTAARHETIEQRISSLHRSLKITPDEDANWNNVAQAMRDNESQMQKLAATATAQAPQSMTAPQDLIAYEKAAQAHVDGLKNLRSSFDTLYNAMPDPQKKVADQVFMQFGRPRAPAPAHS
jgi:hypothetical protein